MKNNHENVIAYITQAIYACKEDAALLPVKRYLMEALRLTDKVGKKRVIRDSQSKQFAEQAKKNHERWMEMLKNIQLPGLKNDEE